MIRLHITTEGATEMNFVKQILARSLAKSAVFADARSVLTGKDNRISKEFRGGMTTYHKAKKDILTWMKEDNHPECRFSTMFDLYRLPQDFPGFDAARHVLDAYDRVRTLEQAFLEDIGDPRFIPYIQLHEFEAFILADPEQLDWEYIDHEGAIAKLVQMVGNQNPELINDGFETAPSKRIIREIPEYDKRSAGVSIAGKIGLSVLRNRCRHFNEWVTTLEQIK